MVPDRRVIGLALAVLVAAACGGPPATTPVAVESPVPPATPVETVAAIPEPPAAALAAEGGDPVTGQLGTYTWANGGSDAPWLPGSPLAVGAVEPLTVTVERGVPIESWEARVAPAGQDDPTGAASLGSGAGQPAFEAPVAGDWTLEVRVEFAGGLGTASYFWALTVS